MACKEHCHFTGTIDNKTGRHLMIKPSTHEVHPRCESCEREELEHGRLMVIFNNYVGMVRKYEELKKKF